MWLFNLYDSDLLDTLAEGRSKVRDAKEASVVVVGADFLAGVKTEGVASMLKQVKSRHDGCCGTVSISSLLQLSLVFCRVLHLF
jgi:hypothetical protein